MGNGWATLIMESAEISTKTIEKDIKSFRKRLNQAQDKLTDLPKSAGTYRDRKKLKVQKHALSQEIEHVQKLIQIAQERL